MKVKSYDINTKDRRRPFLLDEIYKGKMAITKRQDISVRITFQFNTLSLVVSMISKEVTSIRSNL